MAGISQRACRHSAIGRVLLTLIVLAIYAGAARGQPLDMNVPPPGAAKPETRPDLRDSVCLMIKSAARSNDLPLEFFARVIWQESRFQSHVRGTAAPAAAIARRASPNSCPGTAAERGLLDPFDPVQALPKSAEFLRELRRQFGNLGLAAAAYNAGPQRVRDWLAGRRTLPAETRNYVSRRSPGDCGRWLGGQ